MMHVLTVGVRQKKAFHSTGFRYIPALTVKKSIAAMMAPLAQNAAPLIMANMTRFMLN